METKVAIFLGYFVPFFENTDKLSIFSNLNLTFS